MAKIRTSSIPSFSTGQLETICKVLGDTSTGLTGSEIGHLLAQSSIEDTDPDMTKWKRLYNALAQRMNIDGHGSAALTLIKYALDPARYKDNSRLFERRRRDVNVSLAFVGLEYRPDGRFYRTAKAATLSEAEKRADRLRSALIDRSVHHEVLKYCNAELLENNCFHAVLEATKSVAAKIRYVTGVEGDGGGLVDKAFGGEAPLIQINQLSTASERSEQQGFSHLLKGLFGVFRNPTAHSPRIEWSMPEDDALDLFVIASYAHRRIDARSSGS